jgi:hypothetical protein
MDPVELILTALAAGVTSGVTQAASSAVQDAYNALRALVRKRLAGRPKAEFVLAEHANAPDTWRAPLAAELAEAGADRDADLVAAAQALMNLLDAAAARAGKYTVDVRDAYGVQVGDRNRQENVFQAQPGGG